uniref:Hexose transporter 1 n=1 Tax=Globisporangium ultimum (strain ATCC 200006 / CBS 805.95 / DAOM BR144) TaxID=431595 RepID=K3X7K1_GLOUD
MDASRKHRHGDRTYAIAVSIFASLGGLYFGYEQGATGGALVLHSFVADFCVGWHSHTYKDCTAPLADLPAQWLQFVLAYNLTYNVGCIVGALLGGYLADAFGRRVMIFSAGLLFCIGTLWVWACPAHAHGSLLMARVLQGVGVGNSSFSLPIYGGELVPTDLQALFFGFTHVTIVTGVLLASAVNVVVQTDLRGWRITNGVAMIVPVVVMIGIFFVPENPRWTYEFMGKDAAKAVLQRLRQRDNVTQELRSIGDQIAREGGTSTGWHELWTLSSMRRRVLIVMTLHVLQQATGINQILAYGGLLFKDVMSDGVSAVFMLTIVNFVATVPTMRWVDTLGRRQLLLIGAIGMALSHLVSAITLSQGCGIDNSECSKPESVVVMLSAMCFIFSFAVSWGPLCWIYAVELFPISVRAKAVSITAMANWVMGAAMTFVVQLVPSLRLSGLFFLFAATCAASALFVFFVCPETKDVDVDDMDALFAAKEKNGYKKLWTASPQTHLSNNCYIITGYFLEISEPEKE